MKNKLWLAGILGGVVILGIAFLGKSGEFKGALRRAAAPQAVGELTVSLDPASPAASVIAPGAVNQTLAKFTFRGNGEEKIRIKKLGFQTTGTINPAHLLNVRILDEHGTKLTTGEVGPANRDGLFTAHIVQDKDRSLVVGSRTFTVMADVDHKAVEHKTFGVSVANAQSVTALGIVSGQNMRTNGNFPVSGALMTVRGFPAEEPSLSLTRNNAFVDQSVVAGGTDIHIGSFILTLGGQESVDLQTILLGIDTDEPANITDRDDDVSGVRMIHLEHNGNVVGPYHDPGGDPYQNVINVQNFTIHPGESKVIDVYARIASQNAPRVLRTFIPMSGVVYRGVASGTVSWIPVNGPLALQTMTVLHQGRLEVEVSANSPIARTLYTGSLNQEVARFKFRAIHEPIELRSLTVDLSTEPQYIGLVHFLVDNEVIFSGLADERGRVGGELAVRRTIPQDSDLEVSLQLNVNPAGFGRIPGDDQTLQAKISNADSIRAVGRISAEFIAAQGQFPVAAAVMRIAEPASLVVSLSDDTPISRNISINGENQEVARFDLRARGQDIELQSFRVHLGLIPFDWVQQVRFLSSNGSMLRAMHGAAIDNNGYVGGNLSQFITIPRNDNDIISVVLDLRNPRGNEPIPAGESIQVSIRNSEDIRGIERGNGEQIQAQSNFPIRANVMNIVN